MASTVASAAPHQRLPEDPAFLLNQVEETDCANAEVSANRRNPGPGLSSTLLPRHDRGIAKSRHSDQNGSARLRPLPDMTRRSCDLRISCTAAVTSVVVATIS